MPYTFNGFGTIYYGLANETRVRGTCEACENEGTLCSYDTTLWVVLALIPIVRLGRKRVFDMCPRCNRHRVMPLAAWHAQCRELSEVAATGARLEASSTKAAEALALRATARDESGFRALADEFAALLARDPEALLRLAAGHESFGRIPDAEKALRAALALRDEPKEREALAGLLIRARRSIEAGPLLEHVLREWRADRQPLFVAYVRGLRDEGRTAEARAAIARLKSAVPDIAAEPELRWLEEGLREKRGFFHTRAGTVTAFYLLIVLAIAGWCAYSAWLGARRPLWLVNGLPRAYEIELDGVRRTLAPHAVERFVHGEGTARVRIVDPDLGGPEVEHRMETTFWTRPARPHTFLLNPDEAAFLVVAEAVYGGFARPADDRVRTGDAFVILTEMDLEFEEFPATLELKRGQMKRLRRVFQAVPRSAREGLSWATDCGGRESARKWIRRSAEAAPDDEWRVRSWLRLAGPAEYVPWAEPWLERRPVAIEIHRAYQDAADRLDPARDLESEAAARLARAPDDQDLSYLLARATRDPGRAGERLRACADRGHAFALGDLARRELMHGDRAGALELADRAVAARTDSTALRGIRRQAAWAAGRYSELVEEARARRSALDLGPIVEEVVLLVQDGRTAEAETRVRTVGALLNEGGWDELGPPAAEVEAAYEYARGDLARYRAMFPQRVGAPARFEEALDAGRLSEALEIARKGGSPPYRAALVHLAAGRVGDASVAKESWTALVEALGAAGPAGRSVAAALAADRPPDPERALSVPGDPAEIACLLVAIGRRFPTETAGWLDRARPLDFRLDFPHRQIAAELGR